MITFKQYWTSSKNCLKDVIGYYCLSYFHILYFTPLSINNILLHYHKINLLLINHKKISWINILHCISSFEGTFYTKLQDTATSCFISCSFISGFTLADINFYNFLELHSALSEKHFATNFPFLTDSAKPCHILNNQNPLTVTKAFCRCSLKRLTYFALYTMG